ncbi:MAG: TRAP transporter small permease subunit, partial [Oscillospiraceae bacterium]
MKFFNTIDKVTKGFLAVLLLFATGLLFTNVVLRYCFHAAIFWTEEMLRYIMVWITLIGMSICVSEDSHISIDVLSNLIKPKLRKLLKIA